MTSLWHRTLRRIGRSMSLVQFIVVTFMLREEILGLTPHQRRPTALIARLTGDGERYAEEWAAEWDDLPQRPRRARAAYLVRISTRAIPIGMTAWARKRRKA
ncbi:hypothetical protein [Streptomyces sp. NPDC048350]|uniref:hypothetical protein n=1 Tax=Streptomyces sp. NPDC048350 TaxID=3365538 RepID=UPI00371B3B6E